MKEVIDRSFGLFLLVINNSLIIQHGRFARTAEYETVNLPISYTNYYSITTSIYASDNWPKSLNIRNDKTISSFSCSCRSDGGSGTANQGWWITIGY